MPRRIRRWYRRSVAGLRERTKSRTARLHLAGWSALIAIAAGLGYDLAFAGELEWGDGGLFGNAVLSRFPIGAVRVIELPSPRTLQFDVVAQRFADRCPEAVRRK